ncbi:hypothetical protein BG842_04970 [Haladaptatus sp. W1]|uniref:FAD-dependent monooxygenase n=1 Tax=Haladaptatus sp. W1 TaxID=1897478 RepID=UPI000849E32D|nr:FAD-dependent monooxygenase [Haladaptatus sp. W1]ODR79864.1 hypothetical protein BG842_04970 [Haladaptatus sp. W1]
MVDFTNNTAEKTQQKEGNIIICGAGIAGLTLAWWMERNGWDVLVIEIAPELRTGGYLIDFMGAGYDVAERMDLLHQIKKAEQPIPEVVNVNEDGDRVSEMDYELFREVENGRLLSLMHGDLEQKLYDALSDEVEIRYDLTIDEVEQDDQGLEIILSDGTRERADLLVGADGIHSRVRDLVFGEESRYLRYMGYQTASFIFEDEEVRKKLGGQCQMLTVPRRTVGVYPLQNGKLATFLVHQTSDEERPASPCDTLKRQYGDLDWIVSGILKHCDEVDSIYYDQVAQIEIPHWSRGRVALVGDACGAPSLLAGQGASLAMAGAYVLAQKLCEEDPIEDCLSQYEEYMMPEVQKKQADGRRTAKWLFPSSQWYITVRNLGLKLARIPGGSRLLKPVLGSGTESIVKKV